MKHNAPCITTVGINSAQLYNLIAKLGARFVEPVLNGGNANSYHNKKNNMGEKSEHAVPRIFC